MRWPLHPHNRRSARCGLGFPRQTAVDLKTVPMDREQPERYDAIGSSDGNRAADARFCSFPRDGRCRGSPNAPEHALTALHTALQRTISSAVRSRFRVVAEASAATPLGAAATSRLICFTSESYSRSRR